MIRDKESGRIVRNATDEEVLQAVDDGYQTTREIAERFDVTQSVARNYLLDLLNQGKLDRRSVGTTYVYRRVKISTIGGQVND
jgi:predicted transcriptional regulator